jgi:prolyl-tRNA synthetase
LGTETIVVSASSGIMGGSESHEFMVPSESGEDNIVFCEKCGYSSNVDVADTEFLLYPQNSSKLDIVHTPVSGSVKDVSEFLSIPEYMLMKSLLFIDKNGEPFFVLIRGDYDINENKFIKIFGDARPANDEEIKRYTGAQKGYISPVGLNIKSYADITLKDGKNLVSGANKDDYHYKGIEIGRDFKIADFVDVRNVKEGELCKRCGSPVVMKRTIELGHIFKLGKKYSQAIGANFQDKDGRLKPITMGSYGIGIERIMATAIEVYNDKDGIIWPYSISPFDCILTLLDIRDNKSLEISEKIYNILSRKYDILYDDRDIGPGSKFKDADLIGVPVRITIGPKTMKEGKIEISQRGKDFKEKIEPEKIEENMERIWKNLKS